MLKIALLALAGTLFLALPYDQTGKASYYSNSMNGRRTSSGELYKSDSLTAAHASLPLGAYVLVTNLKNDSVVRLKINDRMHQGSRIIDVSLAAAKKLNFVRDGIATVRVQSLP
ncbi:MAG: hypothetical protein RLZZ301_892 [Bacteroidota bacterium]